MNRKLLASAAVVLSAGFAAPAYAQTQTGTGTPAEPSAETRARAQQRAGQDVDRESRFEEIVVTARRRDESLQNVPVAITALSGDQLVSRQVNDFEDLQYTVPSLVFQQSVTRDSNRISIRGQGTSYDSRFASVETNIAEVPISSGSGASLPLYDIQSVQVLKGPQGVAFGRNSSGGAIIITPASPIYRLEGYLKLGFGNYNARELEAVINMPVIDSVLAVRASAHLERRDGTTRNLITGTLLDNRKVDAARLSILFEPGGGITNSTVIALNTIDTVGSSNHVLAVNPTGQVAQFYRPPFYSGSYNWVDEANLGVALGRDAIRSDFDGYLNRTTFFLSNVTTLEVMDGISLKNIFGLQRTSGFGFGTDMDGTPLSVITLGRNRDQGKIPMIQTLSDEAQLQGSVLGDGSWLVGVFASWEHPVKDGRPNSSITLEGLTITANSTPTITDAEARLTSFAPYAQITLPLDFIADGVSFTAGARHTRETLRDQTLIRQGQAQICTSSPTCDYVYRSGVYEGWNYALTLNYQISSDALIYAAHRHGFKGGGLNRVGTPPDVLVVNPEFVDDIEVGFKTDWQIGDVSMRTDVAGYNQWYRDIVRSEFVFIGGTAYNVNRNVASAIIRGLEIEQTVAFSRALRLTAGYAFTDAYFTTESVAVRQFPEVPRHQFNLNANARLPLPVALGELLVNANWSQRSSQATDQNAVSPAAFRPGYSLLDLSLNWNNAFGAGLDIAAYIKNATDEVYILAGGDFLSSLGFLQGIYGEPRTYGLRLTYRFGD